MGMLTVVGAPGAGGLSSTAWDASTFDLTITWKPGWGDGVNKPVGPIKAKLNAAKTGLVLADGSVLKIPGTETGAGQVRGPELTFAVKGADVSGVPHSGEWVQVCEAYAPGLFDIRTAYNATVGNNPAAAGPAGLSVSDVSVTVAPYPIQAIHLPPGYDFITDSLGGVLNWNDATNCAPGIGPTLLTGNATNGPTTSGEYYHVQNIAFAAVGGNMTQIAYPYQVDLGGANDVYIRSRFSSTWTPWERIVTAKALPAIPVGGFTVTNTQGQTGAITGVNAAIQALDFSSRMAFVRIQFAWTAASQLTGYSVFTTTLPAGWNLVSMIPGIISQTTGVPGKAGMLAASAYFETQLGAQSMQLDLVLAAT